MTDRLLLSVDQNARASHPVTDLPHGWEQVRVWEAETVRSGHVRKLFAFFNLSDASVHLHARWSDLGVSDGRHTASDLTSHHQFAPSDNLEIELAKHGTQSTGCNETQFVCEDE